MKYSHVPIESVFICQENAFAISAIASSLFSTLRYVLTCWASWRANRSIRRRSSVPEARIIASGYEAISTSMFLFGSVTSFLAREKEADTLCFARSLIDGNSRIVLKFNSVCAMCFRTCGRNGYFIMSVRAIEISITRVPIVKVSSYVLLHKKIRANIAGNLHLTGGSNPSCL